MTLRWFVGLWWTCRTSFFALRVCWECLSWWVAGHGKSSYCYYCCICIWVYQFCQNSVTQVPKHPFQVDLEAEALGILSGHFTVDLSECLYISWEVDLDDLDDSVQLLISVIFHQRWTTCGSVEVFVKMRILRTWAAADFLDFWFISRVIGWWTGQLDISMNQTVIWSRNIRYRDFSIHGDWLMIG
jgi:hypothetical protein